MPPMLNFGLEFGLSLLVFALLAKWYLWPWLTKRSFTHALLILLAPFLLRFLGLMTLVPGVVEPSVTQSTFAFYQAYGDFIAFLLAFTSFILVKAGRKHALAAVWLFNIFGTLDFLNAVIRGAVFGTGGGLGAFWYIPVCYVPMGLVVHYLIFVLLASRSAEYKSQSRA